MEQIKILAVELREKIIDNLRDNIEDQMQKDTIVEYASCFDLTLPISKEDRIELARNLFRIYGTEYSHVVADDDGHHMVESDASFFSTWTVTIKYEPTITCSEEEFISELEKLWPVFNRNWGRFKDIKTTAIQKFYYYIIDNYMINYPNVCEMLLILMGAAPNTSPLERSYSKLTKICYKDRNRLGKVNLEALYLLAVHNISDDIKEEIFESARGSLEA